MATTTKTLTPTNQTITLPDMTERPNASILVDGIGKDADAINALSDQIAKFAYSEKSSGSVNGNSNGTVIVDMPSGATEIIAIIPFGFNPGSSWDTILVFSGKPDISTRTIYFHTIGSTAQAYGIKALVIYR